MTKPLHEITMSGMKTRTQEESMDHFIDRLYQRYGIKLTEDEYDHLDYDNFQGVFKKNKDKTIGFTYIKGRRVWVIKSYNHGFLTVIPVEVETDDEQLLHSCFPRYARNLAGEVYQDMMIEIHGAKTDFETDRDAAMYYMKNNRFVNTLMGIYKNGQYDPWKVMRMIKRILSGRHPNYTLSIVNRN